jgi:hypothetical protein
MLPRSPRLLTLILEPFEISGDFLIQIAALRGFWNNCGNSSDRVGTTW